MADLVMPLIREVIDALKEIRSTFLRQLTHTIKDNHLLLENQIYQQRQLTEIYRRFQNSKRLDDVTFSVGSTSSSTRQFSEH